MTLRIGETKKNNAFTLIEILLVVIIAGIVLALAVPNFSKGYSRFQLNQTVNDLLSVSGWAQAMSIGQQRIYALSFSSDHRSYQLQRAKVSEDIDEQDSFEPVSGTLGRMHELPNAISVVLMQPNDFQGTGNMDRIGFYPDGTIDPATIQLASPDQKTVLSSTEVRGMITKVSSE